MSGEHVHDDHHDHEGHINTIAPFVFSLASAIMFIGLVMATAGENSGYWLSLIHILTLPTICSV